ncbi:hypothetical protein ACFE04_004423 [Oxalis oulophora]
MYNPSNSSSSSYSQKSINNIAATAAGLTRYGSAPSSLIQAAVDSIAQQQQQQQPQSSNCHNYLINNSGGGDSSSGMTSTESTCKVNDSTSADPKGIGLQRSYGFNEIGVGGSLLRQKSSPAGFFTNLNVENNNINGGTGFTITKERGGGYNSRGGGSNGESGLKSQLSFTRQDSLSLISEVSENGVDGIGSDNNGNHKNRHSYATTSNFGMDSWENANSIMFSSPSNKRAKNMDGDFFNTYNALETQFSLPQTTLEMATVEKLLHIPEDSVPCKIRAKRGFATHPRSIAERERRTRISGKLKKLQDLVPNMDKQTSYADMLDLAVQHIKGLQYQVQIKCNKRLTVFDYVCRNFTPSLKIARVDADQHHDILIKLKESVQVMKIGDSRLTSYS